MRETLFFLDGEGIGANELPLRFCGKSDEDVLAYVHSIDEILVTHDNGFFDEKRHPPETNPGVVVVPGGSGDLREHYPLIAHVLKLIQPHRGLWRHTYVRIHPEATVVVKIPASDDRLPMRLVRIVFDSDGKPEVFSAEDWVSK